MKRTAIGVLLGLIVTACSAAQTAQPGGQTAPTGGAEPQAQSQPAAAGTNGFEGSLATSGLYSATWTAQDGENPGPFNAVDSVTVTSDKGTFGNVSVKPDGSISFGSAAPELSAYGLSWDGTGAQVTLDETAAFVCAFTVDTDVASSDGTKLHIAGTMTAHWHPESAGGLNCP